MQDHLFTNAAKFDFTLRADSPAIDAGVNVGFSFKGAAPDLGAQELGETPLSLDEGTQGAVLPGRLDLLQSYPILFSSPVPAAIPPPASNLRSVKTLQCGWRF